MCFSSNHQLQGCFRLALVILLTLATTGIRTGGDVGISGRVVDAAGQPVAGAIVRVQATAMTALTDADGQFTIHNTGALDDVMVTAWKLGYFNGGVRIEDETDSPEIVLAELHPADNPDYEWVDPRPNPDDEVKNCGDCHASIIYSQWSNNGHFKSATSPLFMSLYNGKDISGEVAAQPGYRIDYPHSNGNCANCHAPAAAVKDYTGVDMNKLSNVELMGVSCDFCHKVKDVAMQANTSLFSGVQHMNLLRPPDGHQMFFGPYDDIPDPDAYSPVISESIFCAPCHEGSFWGVPIYESYSEWLASPYAEQGVTCQKCHMPPDGVTSNFAPGKGGMERDPASIPSHFQLGSRDSSFLASAVEMKTTVKRRSGKLTARVAIENVAAGHHVPTDQPMRNMILLVAAVDANGKQLPYIGENRVPVWGGRGKPEDGDFAGLPGKGFAKVLFEPNPLYNADRASLKGKHVFPAPQWRIIAIKEDTRIAAFAIDVTEYEFDMKKAEFPVRVSSKLIYRRTFRNWAKMKHFDLQDITLAEGLVRIPARTEASQLTSRVQ